MPTHHFDVNQFTIQAPFYIIVGERNPPIGRRPPPATNPGTPADDPPWFPISASVARDLASRLNPFGYQYGDSSQPNYLDVADRLNIVTIDEPELGGPTLTFTCYEIERVIRSRRLIRLCDIAGI